MCNNSAEKSEKEVTDLRSWGHPVTKHLKIYTFGGVFMSIDMEAIRKN